MGLNVRSAPPALGYDLVINGSIRVTLRAAFPSNRRHRVTVGKRTYEYRYPTWHFNFHQHGRLDERYTDFFVCLAVRPTGKVREEAFIIPWARVTGKTFSLHGGKRAYGGRYAPLRDAWALIGDAAKRYAPLRDVA